MQKGLCSSSEGSVLAAWSRPLGHFALWWEERGWRDGWRTRVYVRYVWLAPSPPVWTHMSERGTAEVRWRWDSCGWRCVTSHKSRAVGTHTRLTVRANVTINGYEELRAAAITADIRITNPHPLPSPRPPISCARLRCTRLLTLGSFS